LPPIRGETVELPSGASITLSPSADVPPILIVGAGTRSGLLKRPLRMLARGPPPSVCAMSVIMNRG
jgi:hypothetical protein